MQVEVNVAGAPPVLLDDEALARHEDAVAALPAATPVRWALAAAHVAWNDDGEVDWQATRAIRRRLIHWGLGVAEAMDTAQRAVIGWPISARLIEECGRLAPPGGFIAGAAADQRPVSDPLELVDAVVEQAAVIQRAGGDVMLLALPQLIEWGVDADGFVAVYGAIIDAVRGPLFVHWLGDAFAPNLRGYFPGDSFARIMSIDSSKVRGAKLSLLDPARERALRADLGHHDQIVLTGDDLHFAGLIAGSGEAARWLDIGDRSLGLGDFSHALLGIFDAGAAPASLALRYLADGQTDKYTELMQPLEALAAVVFEPPVHAYHAGLAFLSWLNGEQDHLRLAGGAERSRASAHYLEVARLAAAAGVLRNATVAAERLQTFLA